MFNKKRIGFVDLCVFLLNLWDVNYLALIFDHWVLSLEIRRAALFFLMISFFDARVSLDSSVFSRVSASSRLFLVIAARVFFVSVRSSDRTALLRMCFFLSWRKLFMAAFLFGIVYISLKCFKHSI